MSYPTPMDIAESEDREADLLEGLPFTREEWQRMDAERLELLAANDALAARLDAAGPLMLAATAEINRLQARLAEREAQLAEYENVIIPSWKREEDMWRQDEADAIEFRRVLAEELDKRDADIARLKAWLRDYQPRAAASAPTWEAEKP